MSVSRTFIKPVTVEPPPQGDYSYLPVLLVVESDTAAGLQAALDTGIVSQAEDLTAYYVIEAVEYQVVVTKHSIGGTPAELLYSALIHASQALKV